MRLASEEFRFWRLRRFHSVTRSRAAAEEEHAKRQQAETKILLFAEENGHDYTGLEPQLALALACAARDTLLAEEEMARLRIQEQENFLETLKDEADITHAPVIEANRQIGSILTSFNIQHLHVDIRNFEIEPSSCFPDSPYLSSDNEDTSSYSGTQCSYEDSEYDSGQPSGSGISSYHDGAILDA